MLLLNAVASHLERLGSCLINCDVSSRFVKPLFATLDVQSAAQAGHQRARAFAGLQECQGNRQAARLIKDSAQQLSHLEATTPYPVQALGPSCACKRQLLYMKKIKVGQEPPVRP